MHHHRVSHRGAVPVTSITADSSSGLLGTVDHRDPHHLKAALKQHLGSQSSIKVGEGTRNPSCDSHGWDGACSSTSISSETEYLPFDATVTLTKYVEQDPFDERAVCTFLNRTRRSSCSLVEWHRKLLCSSKLTNK